MTSQSRIRRLFSPSVRGSRRKTARPFRPGLETLEDRTAPAVFTVNSTLNVVDPYDGVLDLPEAVHAANNTLGADTVVFDNSLNGATIDLNGTLMDIDHDLTIVGPGANQLTIDARELSRIFWINRGTTVRISGLTLTRGFTAYGSDPYQIGAGGAIFTAGSLFLDSCVLRNNGAAGWGGGGAIGYGSEANLTVTNSNFVGNKAPDGGAIGYAQDWTFHDPTGTLEVRGCTFTGNSATRDGGAISVTWSQSTSFYAVIDLCTFSDNSAGSNGGGISSAGPLTVGNCTLNHNSAGENGGGVSNSVANLTLVNCTLSENSATLCGGAIDNFVADMTVINCQIRDNTADQLGGGLYLRYNPWNTSTLLDSVIERNAAGAGGGIYYQGGNGLRVTRTTIRSNSASASGGGIYNASGYSTLTDCIVQNNSTAYGDGGGAFNAAYLIVNHSNFSGNSGESGGAIFNNYNLTVTDSTFSGNRAIDGGGIATYEWTTITGSSFTRNSADFGGAIRNTVNLLIYGCSFTANVARTGSGGGISNSNGLVLQDTTLASNLAGDGGGGVASDGYMHLINCTLSGNTANGDGGGVWNGGQLIATNSTIVLNQADADGNGIGTAGGVWVARPYVTRLFNTIVAGNLHGTAAKPDDLSGDNVNYQESANNLIGDVATSGGLTNGVNGNIVGALMAKVLDPVLKDNGGPTLTHALIPDSPAINAGSNALAVDGNNSPLATDQRGQPRIVGATVDIGAYELQNVSPFVTSFARIGAEDNRVAFSAADFSSHFSDPDGDAMIAVRILTLPASGTLRLGRAGVSAGQVIAAADLYNLVFVPALNFNGEVTFSYTASDGITGFAPSPAKVSLRIRSALEQVADLKAQLDALLAAGVLNSRQNQSLKEELNLTGNRSDDATSTRRFIDDVNNYVATAVLRKAQADPLLAAANVLQISITTA